MNFIKCEKLEKSMAELQFSIDAEAFKAAVADVFKKEGKKYPVQGFRKGKAPKALIEKMYGADVFTYDAINELFPAAYEEAVKAAGIEPVGRPEVSVDSASEAEGATLTVKVAVKPEVKIGAYNGLTVEKTVHTVSDEAVEAELKRVQERNARELTREGAAENGDIVDIDFEGFVDGVAFEGGKAEHYSLTLGSGSFIPGFEDQIVGHSAGEEFDVNVTFPTEYQAAELAGKAAVVHGAGEVGVQAALHPQHSVLLVARLQAGDELIDLHHKIDLRLRVGAGGKLDALDHRANRHGAVALDKVLQLGQRHHHVAQFFGGDAACHDIGQFEGLVFSNFDLVHVEIPLCPIVEFPPQRGGRNRQSQAEKGQSTPSLLLITYYCSSNG